MATIQLEQQKISLEEAAEILRCLGANVKARTLYQWIIRAKNGDPKFKKLPYHQVADGFPIGFHKEMLIRWWNNRYNIT